MTNFDFLTRDGQFNTFSDVAVAAEKIIHIDPSACVINCRRAMEFAIKWMYSVDSSLVLPYQDTLVSLMSTEEFRELIGDEVLYNRMASIRKQGNNAAHNAKSISYERAEICLKNLHIFMDFVACCYSAVYEPVEFDAELLKQHDETLLDHSVAINFEQLMAENAAGLITQHSQSCCASM